LTPGGFCENTKKKGELDANVWNLSRTSTLKSIGRAMAREEVAFKEEEGIAKA